MMRRLIAAFFLVTAFAIQCVAAGPVKIEYKFKPGEVNRYKMVVTAGTEDAANPAMAQLLQAVAVMKQKTLSVNRDGSAKIQMIVESMKFNTGGAASPMDTKGLPPATVLMTKTGETKMLSGDASAVSGMNNPLLSGGLMSTPMLPSRPLSKGQTWTQALPEPLSGKAFCKLVSDNVKMGSYTTAQLSYRLSGKLDMSKVGTALPVGASQKPMPLSGQFMLYISPQTGKMIRSEGTMRLRMTMPPQASSTAPAKNQKPASMTMKMKMEMFLIP